MEKRVSLERIINEVLMEKNIQKNEGVAKSLRRNFYNFIQKIGGDVKSLKQEDGKFNFEEAEVPIIKIIISQIYDNSGIIFELANEGKRDKGISSEDIRNFIQAVLDEAEKANFSEDEQIRLGQFLSRVCQWSLTCLIEELHNTIDLLVANMQDLTQSQQIAYLSTVLHIVKKDYALRVVESLLNMKEMAHIVEDYKKYVGASFDNDLYYEVEPEIRAEYIRRDRQILEAIQEDNDLRQYIEKKFCKKAEEIFDYALLDMPEV